MTDPTAAISGPLAGEYEILGELRGITDATEYRARRRADAQEVLIRVWSGSTVKTREALPQFAADARLLVGLRHPAIAPVLAAEWLTDDRLAVVYEYLPLPTLEEQVDRGEEFSFPRLAAILRGINGALEWAREQKVVHRGVTLESLYLEPGSDRGIITFVNGPVPVGGVLDPTTDARTLAALAWEVLTRSEQAVEGETLAEMRPDLPKRLVDQTERLREATRPDASLPDAETYVASIAMAEALKQVETEAAETETALRSEERSVREQLEAERRDHERKITEEREKFAAERAALLAAVTKERESLLAAAAKEREELAAAATREHEELVRAVQRERDELARLRDDLERSVLREREQIAAMRQELLDAGLEPPEGLGIVAPTLVMPVVPQLGRIAKRNDVREVPTTVRETADVTSAETERVAGPTPVKRTPRPFAAATRPTPAVDSAPGSEEVAPGERRRTLLWASGAGGLLLVGVVAALVWHGEPAWSKHTTTPASAGRPAAVATRALTVDSAAGAIATDSARQDSVARDSAAVADSIASARAAARERARQRAADSVAAAHREAARRDSIAAAQDPFAIPIAPPRRDSSAAGARTDSAAMTRPPAVAPVTRTQPPAPRLTPRRDTARAAPDTTRVPPPQP